MDYNFLKNAFASRAINTNKNVKEEVDHKQNHSLRHLDLYNLNKLKIEKIKLKQDIKEHNYNIESTRECTFKPKLNKEYLNSNIIHSSKEKSINNKTSLIDRQLEWERNRLQRLEVLKNEKKEKEIKECLFKPKTVNN